LSDIERGFQSVASLHNLAASHRKNYGKHKRQPRSHGETAQERNEGDITASATGKLIRKRVSDDPNEREERRGLDRLALKRRRKVSNGRNCNQRGRNNCENESFRCCRVHREKREDPRRRLCPANRIAQHERQHGQQCIGHERQVASPPLEKKSHPTSARCAPNSAPLLLLVPAQLSSSRSRGFLISSG
jgi:hypothetical protein